MLMMNASEATDNMDARAATVNAADNSETGALKKPSGNLTADTFKNPLKHGILTYRDGWFGKSPGSVKDGFSNKNQTGAPAAQAGLTKEQ